MSFSEEPSLSASQLAEARAAETREATLAVSYSCYSDSSTKAGDTGGPALPPPRDDGRSASTQSPLSLCPVRPLQSFPLKCMWAYVDGVVAAGPPSDGQLYTIQSLWQESDNAVVVGELHGSTLLEDESRSGQ